MTLNAPTFNQLMGHCEIDWTILKVDRGHVLALTATQASYVSLQDDGSIDIDIGNDYSVVD